MLILTDWYRANKLSLNVNKTVLLKFWPDNRSFTIKVGDTELTNVRCTRFLGVAIDDCLTWKEHVGNLYNKIQANKRLLINVRNLLPTDSLHKIYFAHVYSHLMYSIVVWGLMIPKSLHNSLCRLQK